MANSNSSPDQGAHFGKGSDQSLSQSMPADPSHITPANTQQGQDTKSSAIPPVKKLRNEEPGPTLEPDLPSDGRDEKGEAMIRDLPQRPELSEPPSQPSPSSIKP